MTAGNNDRATGRASIALCFDRAYLIQAEVCIWTIGRAWSGQCAPELDLVHAGDLTKADQEDLRRIADLAGANVRMVDAAPFVEEITNRLPPVRFPHLSVCTWLKIYVPRILTDREQVLYLDTDILVCDDLSPLVGREIPDGSRLEAVRDFGIPYLGTQFLSKDRFPTHDGEAHLPYFNAGVMHIDVERWNAAETTERAVAAALDTGDPAGPLFGDQDVLNMVVRGEFELLDPRYNVALMRMLPERLGFEYQGSQAYPDDYLSFLANRARIVHFVTELKPWSVRYPIDEPYGRQWLQHRSTVQEMLAGTAPTAAETGTRTAPVR